MASFRVTADGAVLCETAERPNGREWADRAGQTVLIQVDYGKGKGWQDYDYVRTSEASAALPCPRCNQPGYGEGYSSKGCSHCGLKPPYSKDRRLQLCYRCNRYSGRSARFCTHCEK